MDEKPEIDVAALIQGNYMEQEVAYELATSHNIDYEDAEIKEEVKGAYDSITYDDPQIKIIHPAKKRTNIFVRVRPLAASGTHGKGGVPSEKQLDEWDEKSVKISDSRGLKTENYRYPDLVIGPEVNQDEAYNEVMPELIDAFLGGYNCTFVAYGQTGTGKTHTMFGSPGSLKSFSGLGDIHPEWGIFPRAVIQMMKKMKKQKGVKYLFTASVVELYLQIFYDLLNDRKKITFPCSERNLIGYREVKLQSPEDVKDIIYTAINMRVSSGTKCNQNSSRSHCVAIINLLTLTEDDEMLVDRTFMFADFSGSERTSKTGESMYSNYDQRTFNQTGIEGIMTNWDLYHLGRELDIIAETIRKRGQGKAIQNRDSMLAELLKKSLDGQALTSVMLCLSQAPQSGGETWFTMKYGLKFANLVVKVFPQKARSLSVILKKINDELKTVRGAIKSMESTAAGRKNRFLQIRYMRLRQLEGRKEILGFFQSDKKK